MMKTMHIKTVSAEMFVESIFTGISQCNVEHQQEIINLMQHEINKRQVNVCFDLMTSSAMPQRWNLTLVHTHDLNGHLVEVKQKESGDGSWCAAEDVARYYGIQLTPVIKFTEASHLTPTTGNDNEQ
jgi:2',3'-cyclic-nucleotide 2'-phosphodiesterase (5'-nucleotidase family)